MKKTLILLGAVAAVAACEPYRGYEASVNQMEPVYCYRPLGDHTSVDCYTTPYARDGRRFVNYYGPSPQRYEPPPPQPAQKLVAPLPSAYWVKDPEPVPRANPLGN